jgi:hypothetical protein
MTTAEKKILETPLLTETFPGNSGIYFRQKQSFQDLFCWGRAVG